MTKAIQQSVHFNASAEELFEMYLDSKKHSAATGGGTRSSRKVGGRFAAWDGQLKGKNILIVPKKMIVPVWRAAHRPGSDLDSILVLRFGKTPTGGKVDIVQAGVPEHDHKGVS